MNDFATAFGLLLVLEGLLYAAFPKAMRHALTTVLQLQDGVLRRYGLAVAIIGLVILYLLRWA